MDLQLKKIDIFVRNKIREKWLSDPLITKYIDHILDDQENNPADKTAFSHNYEIIKDEKLIGDVKVFGYKEDLKRRTAQFLIILGEDRGSGIGSKIVEILLEKLKKNFISIYCYVNRYNIASIKMLQKNGFLIKNLKKNEVILYKNLL